MKENFIHHRHKENGRFGCLFITHIDNNSGNDQLGRQSKEYGTRC